MEKRAARYSNHVIDTNEPAPNTLQLAVNPLTVKIDHKRGDFSKKIGNQLES